MVTKFFRMALLAVALLTASAGHNLAQDLGQAGDSDLIVAQLEERVAQFLEGLSRGKVVESYADLLRDSSLSKPAQADALKTLIDRTRELEKKYGKYRGYDRVDAKRVGKDLVMLRYLYKCDEFPVVWYVAYYRDFKRSDTIADANAWVVVSVRFDADLELLLQ
jgi:transcriptional regulator NrdR family protein